jgi:ABC-type dipeptide/oligopeptide/nickel transport system ATPase component
VADTRIVLSAGRILEAGPVTQVLNQPTDPYTAQLIADIPVMTANPFRTPDQMIKPVQTISDGGQS